ncbi:MAG: AAA family ATPase [Candidatus Hydrogenedentes bacterium]|nr:AAA family ATPase [Candidatus Hydrogenedentota bacterium]
MSSEFHSDVSVAALGQAAGAGASPRNLNIRRLVRMRGALMAGIVLAISIPAMAAIWLVVPREYTASAAIRFSNTRHTVLTDLGGGAISSDYVRHVETQVNLIKGAAVLSLVSGREDIQALPLIKIQQDPEQFLIENVEASLEPGTELVTVSFQSDDRDTALAIVDATVQEYLKLATTAEKTRNDDITRQLIEERNTLEDKVARLRANLSARRENVGSAQLPGENSADSEVRAYYDGLSKALGDQTSAEKEIEQVQGYLTRLEELMTQQRESPQDPIYEFGVEDAVNGDSSVLVQKQMLATSDATVTQTKSRYLEGHPQIRVQEQARDAVATALKQAEAEARAKVLLSRYEETKRQFATATKSLEDAKARVAQFDAELQKRATESRDVVKAMSAVHEEEDALKDAMEELKQVQERIRVLHVESRAPATIEVASEALAPLAPDYGRRFKMMALAFMGSCCAAFAIGLWRELTDQQVRTPLDIGYCTDRPLMAMIPHLSVEQLPEGKNAALLTAEHPDSRSADEVRRLLTRIIYPPEGSAELNTCLVTSATRGDGKTSLACNLAIALAQANRRVLLLDVCARRPGVEKTLGMQPDVGLSEMFANRVSMTDAIHPSPFPNLWVLGPGIRGKELVGKLASRETVDFLEKAEEAFEHVVIDTPPVLLMADAKLLAPVVDGVIAVVGAEVSTLGMARRAIAELQQIGANVIGVVLNRVKHVPGGYMRRTMDTYYNYETEQGGGDEAEEPRISIRTKEAPSILLLEEGDPRIRRGR